MLISTSFWYNELRSIYLFLQIKERKIAMISTLKTNWDNVRTKSVDQVNRTEALVEMVNKIKGQIYQVTLRHDCSRMVQTILQFGWEKQYFYLCTIHSITIVFFRNDQQKKLILKELVPKILGGNIILPINHIANKQLTIYINQISPRRPTVTLQFSKLFRIATTKKNKNLLSILSLDTSYL